MGKSSGPMPSYQAAAQQQADSSRQVVGEQTRANRPDISTPFGQQQWVQRPDGSYGMTTGFTGGLGTAAEGLAAQAGNMAAPMDWSQFGPVQTGDQAREQAVNAAYGQATSRLDPMWQQREDMTRTRLLNQGLDENSQAFRSAMGNFGQERNDAYTSAMNSAIGQGTAAGDVAFRNNLLAQQQAMANALRQRSLPVEELQQMQGLLAMPGFQGAGVADPTQHFAATGAEGQWRQNEAQMQNAFWGDLAGGLFSLGGSFIPKGKK